MRYILKPLGVTTPRQELMPRLWTRGEDLDRFPVITGPADIRRSPDITKPTTVVLHGVGYARAFAIGEMLDLPAWNPQQRYGDRWPWCFPVRVDLWVPDIEDGPRTAELVSSRVMGRIQVGGEFAKLTVDEYLRVETALRACPSAKSRSFESGGGAPVNR